MFKRLTITAIALLLFLLSACGSSSPQAFVDLNCGSDSIKIFEEWQSWTKVNAEPIQSEGHENNRVDIYVDGLANGSYQTASVPMPECARVVKASLGEGTTTAIKNMTIMVKMPAGFDYAHDDWWYGKYDSSGRFAEESGKVPGCIACHQAASESDYLFIQDVMAGEGD